MLTKALLPLPDKWHGLSDVETRYRQRYLDLIASEGSRSTFRARSRVVSTIRRYLEERDFLEVGGWLAQGVRPAVQAVGWPGREWRVGMWLLRCDLVIRAAGEPVGASQRPTN